MSSECSQGTSEGTSVVLRPIRGPEIDSAFIRLGDLSLRFLPRGLGMPYLIATYPSTTHWTNYGGSD
jgi:hypothetical protein